MENKEQTQNMRHHIMSIYGVKPSDVRAVSLSFYDNWDAMGFPIGKPSRIEQIEVSADQCHQGEYWSNFALAHEVAKRGYGRCMCAFI